MRESSGYQIIIDQGREEGIEKGRVEHARSLLLSLGGDALGEVPAEVAAVVAALTDLARLDRMVRRAGRATTWDDLLQTP